MRHEILFLERVGYLWKKVEYILAVDQLNARILVL